MTKPITPNEVARLPSTQIPDEVYEAFNEMIAACWRGTSARFLQKDVVNLIKSKLSERMPGVNVYEKRWLDVEPSYRAVGWDVYYDKPGYNEDYDAYFIFSKDK